MKRILTLSILACAALTTLATEGRDRSPLVRHSEFSKIDISKQEVIGEINLNGNTFKVVTPPGSKPHIHTRADETDPVPTLPPAPVTPVIRDAPGVLQNYCKDVIGYGLGAPVQAYGVASSINWDGDDLYFYDIITAAPMGTYVKAYLEDANIVLPMNQTVLDFDDEDYVLNLGLLRPIFTESEGNIYVWFEYSDDYDAVTYSIDSKGTLILDNLDAKYESPDGKDAAHYQFPNYTIGYYYNDSYEWSLYCDIFQAYDEFNYEKTELPEGLPSSTMTYINGEKEGVIVTVYEDEANDAIYFEGLSAYLPDSVVKGVFVENGTKISVDNNQFIGTEMDLFYVITSTVFLDNKNQLDVVEQDKPVYFVVERDSSGKIMTITADPDSDFFLAFNDDPMYFYPLDIFNELKLTRQDSFAGIPSTPYDAYYENYAQQMGANYIFFRLSSFAYNGDIIDVNNLYYSIFIDGDPVEFEQQNGFDLNDEELTKYKGIKQPTYLVPYTFANSVDLYEDNGGTFVVALYVEGMETVGVQSVYLCDGVETRGGLVTIDCETGKQTVTPGTDTKVETISAADVVAIVYCDLQGRKVGNPGKGLYIKRYRLNDGSVKSVKVIR